MIYDVTPPDDRIDQGDLIDGCPLVGVITIRSADPKVSVFDVTTGRVIVLTQTCDLEQGKTDSAVVAVVEGGDPVVGPAVR